MLRITVTKDGGLPQVSTFDKREITIGRTKVNDLVIGEPGVSSNHARILSTGDGITLIDLESTNGTFVNGERIRGPALVQPGDEVYICAYRLELELDGSGSASMASPEGPPPIGDPPGMAPPGPVGMADGPPPLLGGPPMMGGPEYPTPADLGPPPLMNAPAPVGPEPAFDGPPLLDGPPPLAPPPPVGPPVGADDYDAPPLLSAPVEPIDEAPPPVIHHGEPEAPPPMAPAMAPPPMAPPPMAPPPPVTAPPPDMPPPIAAPVPVPEPEPEDEDPRSSSMVSGQISALENPPPSGPPEPVDLPPPILGARTQMATSPEPRAPSRPEPVHVPADPTPTPMSAPFAPLSVMPTAAPAIVRAPSDDLSDLKGPGAGAEACARVFAVVQHRLAPDGSLPAKDAQTRATARGDAQRLLTEVAQRVPEVQARPWANRIANELCGLGALSAPMADPDVVDVYVHGPGRVLVRRRSEAPAPIDATFSCPAAVELVVRRLTGRPFGLEHPVVDARATSGADVRAVHGSLTSPGPLVTIHRGGSGDAAARGLESLVQARALPSGMATLLHHCVRAGLNLLVCGGPGARTFPWLAALAAEAPEDDRQVVVRPGPEPDPLPYNAVVVHSGALAPREGLGGPLQAIRGALSLAPDRLLVHEVSGPEASEVLVAMGRGLSGTITSVRASSADGGLTRLAALAGLAGDAPDAAARARHVAQSVDLVLAVSRFADGHTRVTQLAEATVSSAGTAQAVDLVTYQPHTGQWEGSGIASTVLGQLARRGIPVDASLLGE